MVINFIRPLLDSTDEAIQMFTAVNMLILDQVLSEDPSLVVQWIKERDQFYLQVIE